MPAPDPTRCPPLSDKLIIADDAELAARLASLFTKPGEYFPVIDGPRMGRSDRRVEGQRRTNAMARAGTKRVMFAGLPADAQTLLETLIGQGARMSVVTREKFNDIVPAELPKLICNREQIGLGLLAALRARQIVDYRDDAPMLEPSQGRNHLVVCEAGEPLSEVIAANYAFVLGADLRIIPALDAEICENLLEAYYSINDYREVSQSDRLVELKQQMRMLIGEIPVPAGGSISFITAKLPLGTAFDEVPCTHLFNYPDLGIAIINGFAAEQKGSRGTNVAVLVDPGTTDTPEIAAAQKLLPPRHMFVRGYSGRGANVSDIAAMVENFPYDFLIFATHCGDVSGSRWTYEFVDSEGRDRRLVVDVGIGVGQTGDPDILAVSQFFKFRSLDGVDWTDGEAKKGLYVGSAIRDWSEQHEGWEPVHKEDIPRVQSSAALAMYDHNYIPIPQALAGENTPIILNNACCSWHELSLRFLYANARVYIGTLIPVTPFEASEFAKLLISKYFGQPFAHAAWAAQRAIYGDTARRPYVVSGVYPQRLRVTKDDVPLYLQGSLGRGLEAWTRHLRTARSSGNDKLASRLLSVVRWHERELLGLEKRYSQKK